MDGDKVRVYSVTVSFAHGIHENFFCTAQGLIEFEKGIASGKMFYLDFPERKRTYLNPEFICEIVTQPANFLANSHIIAALHIYDFC